jgi:hypothetical protein
MLFNFSNAQTLPKQDSELKFQYKEIHNSWNGKVLGSRNIYILLDKENFTLKNLEQMFKSLSNKYPAPKLLTVKVFSDAESLKKMVNYDNPGFSISFVDDEIGKQAQKKFDEERYPKNESDYAEFFRNIELEFFDYYSKDNINKCVRIDLSNSNIKGKKKF